MKYIKDPRQMELFDPFESQMSALAYKRLQGSLYAVFRHLLLSLMPAEELGAHFDESIGRPTKELYSMAGLVLMKEFHNWTTEQAVDAYLYDQRVHYALNFGSDNVSFCERTLERYMKLVRENDMASTIFDQVTTKLIDELELEIDQQRLDSTHVFSDMATFSRTKLMGVTIKRFLVQVKRHHKRKYAVLPKEIRTRYEKNDNAMFADVSKDKEKRSTLRQEVAEQMHFLIQHFSGSKKIEEMATFKNMITVFNQQCEVKDVIKVEPTDDDSSDQGGNSENLEDPEKYVEVRKKTGGDVVQNPSDPEATYDGHKGVGYQVQLAETCNSGNDVQLITAVLPQTAVESDANALVPVLELLELNGRLPHEILADSLYGSDDNVLAAAGKGVALVSPVQGAPPKKEPDQPTPKQMRLQNRRIAQKEEKWRKKYNLRAQEEGTIGSIKRRTGMSRLRVRGEESVTHSVYLKVTGWNIARAAASAKIQDKIKKIIQEMKENLCQKVKSCIIDVSYWLEALQKPLSGFKTTQIILKKEIRAFAA